MTYSSVLPGRYASPLFTVARVLSTFTLSEICRLSGNSKEPVFEEGSIRLWTPASDFPAAANQASATVFLSFGQFPVDQNDCFCAVVSGVDRLRDQLGAFGQTGVPAFRRKSRRFVAQDHDDLVLHIEMGVIVVVELRCRCTVAGKHDGATHGVRSRKAGGHEIMIQR